MAMNTSKTYEVRTRFSLNLGEGPKATSLNVAPGEKLQFDGATVTVRGISGVAPTLVAVIRLGWVREVASSTVEVGDAPELDAPAAVPAQSTKVQDNHAQSGDLAAQAGRRTISSEEYGREVASSRIARAGQASANNSSVITSTTSAQQRRAVVPHEAQVRTASSTQAPAAPREVQYMQPATRARRSIEVQDHDEVTVGGRVRATSTQNSNLLTGNNDAGANDSEIGSASRSARKATISRGPIEKQEVSGVIKGRRATPLQFADDMTKVSAMQASSDPAPIQTSSDPVVGRVRKTDAITSSGGEMTASVTVSAQGEMTVPAVTFASSGPDIVIGKTASISAENDPLYDPANYLGLAESTIGEQPAQVIESSSPEAGSKDVAPDDLEFGDTTTLGASREMLDHEGKVVKLATKGTTVLDDTDTAAAAEEDYTNLNDGVEAGPANISSVTKDEVVPSNYLDTLKVGGMLWAKSPHTAKIAYILGKKGPKGYTGGCENASILLLIGAQAGLPKSVLDAVANRKKELKM